MIHARMGRPEDEQPTPAGPADLVVMSAPSVPESCQIDQRGVLR